MNRLKIGFIVTSAIIVLIGLIITFSLNNNFPTSACKTVFVFTKVLVTVLFIVSVIYTLFSKAKTGSNITLLGLGILYQLLPLGIRFLVKSNVDNKVAYAWTIVLICLGIYVIFGTGLSLQDKFMRNKDDQTKSNEIPVQPEKRLANDDNNE
ncbi:MAG: hypothetical protein K6E20_03175 [Acholeplasmatales bacterium]|nr:hypothetical protein [Acholeplasmatales bacterium]